MDSLKFVWNVPNALSLVRLILLPVFAVLYLGSADNPTWLYWSLAVLVLSGITDFLDGVFARKLNQITELGKLLDPIADKITQITVLVCLVIRYPVLIPLMVICLTKEILQAIGGWILLSHCDVIRGSKWFGKVSTFTFYGVMLLIVLWTEMPSQLLLALEILVAITMLVSFFGYMRIFIRLHKESTLKRKEN